MSREKKLRSEQSDEMKDGTRELVEDDKDNLTFSSGSKISFTDFEGNRMHTLSFKC